MHQDFFTQLSIIVAIGAGISILMRLLRQPLIIGYILTGLLVGPTVLNLVTTGETLEIFSDIGIALLLFLVGLGLNPKIIKEVGKVAVLTGLGQVLFTTLAGYFIVDALTDLTVLGNIYVSLAFSFSSTIIILKLLSDKKEQTRLHGKIAIGFLLVQDIIATLALLFVTANGTGGLKTDELLTLGLKGLALVAFLLIMAKLVLPLLTNTIAKSQELLFLFSIAWGLGIGALFKETGFSLEIGALAAGVALSEFSYAQEAGARLRPLRDFFLVLFFVVLGSQLDFDHVVAVLPAASILSLFILIGNPIIVMAIMGMIGYTKKTSFKTSLAVAQISEFSLVLLLLAYSLGQIDEKTLSLATLIGIITIALSSYMIIYDEKLFSIFSRYLSIFERRKPKQESNKRRNNELILFGYKKGGSEFIRVFKSLKKPYIVVDYDPEVIDMLSSKRIEYLYGDITDLELLDEAGMGTAKLVVSVVTDHETNKFLLNTLNAINPSSTFICHADSFQEAAELYELEASYVMLPHYIGSEKIGAFIKKSGLNKSEFRKFREKHIAYLNSHFAQSPESEDE
jgi:Kef-type K+ transport system membrane component KefB